MADLNFYRELSFKVIIITGASRVGKTTFAAKLATNDIFEFIDEPWLPMYLPVLMKNSLLDESLSKNMMNSYLDELCNDVILYRRANFRPGDASSIWNFKKAENIFDVLLNVKSRKQAKEVSQQKNKHIIICLPELTPFIKFILSLSDNIFLVSISRDVKSIAKEIVQKKWFSDIQLKNPINNQPYYKYIFQNETYFIPWWVDERDFECFVRIDDYKRAEMYYNYFNDQAEKQINSLNINECERFHKINFRDLMDSSAHVIQEMLSKPYFNKKNGT